MPPLLGPEKLAASSRLHTESRRVLGGAAPGPGSKLVHKSQLSRIIVKGPFGHSEAAHSRERLKTGLDQSMLFVQKSLSYNRTKAVPKIKPVVAATGDGSSLVFGYFSHQGAKKNFNEDRVSFAKSGAPAASLDVFCLFDGHGGEAAAQYSAEHFAPGLAAFLERQACPQPTDAELQGFVRGFDQQLINAVYGPPREDRSGCCAICFVAREGRYFVLNTGDCRAVACAGDPPVARQVTTDHRFDQTREAQRVLAAGGQIYRSSGEQNPLAGLFKLRDSGLRDGHRPPLRMFPGNLSVSRALGDGFLKRGYKDLLICDPDVHHLEHFDFVLLGSDGVFESLSNEVLCGLVARELRGSHASRLDAVQAALVEVFTALIASSCEDNVSLVLIADASKGRIFNN